MIVLMADSPLPGRVYDPRTLAEGGTNADDVTDALRDLRVAIRKENTSAAWHREEQDSITMTSQPARLATS